MLLPGLVIDAVVGYQLTGALRGVTRHMIDWVLSLTAR
jgi:hypothetical protein